MVVKWFIILNIYGLPHLYTELDENGYDKVKLFNNKNDAINIMLQYEENNPIIIKWEN